MNRITTVEARVVQKQCRACSSIRMYIPARMASIRRDDDRFSLVLFCGISGFDRKRSKKEHI